MQIDPQQRGKLPTVDPPIPYNSEDGRIKGWRVIIPGQRPLATPAVVDGRIFLGGGFGSYDFYAFDAKTGNVSWQYQTSDDGPTAAVVDDGYVAFNTESCELEVLTVEGRPVWKHWLGDPLMSMPAIGKGNPFAVSDAPRQPEDLGAVHAGLRRPGHGHMLGEKAVVEVDALMSDHARGQRPVSHGVV